MTNKDWYMLGAQHLANTARNVADDRMVSDDVAVTNAIKVLKFGPEIQQIMGEAFDKNAARFVELMALVEKAKQ